MSRPIGILSNLRVVEVSAFVAAPLGGAALAALGADVIRVDPIGGGIDARRWPLHEGRSLYWDGLNQGKRSVTLDLRSERGLDLLADLVSAPGEGGGILLTNLPVRGRLSYEELRGRRHDLVMLVITGNPDGSTAVDYTVNAAVGFPWVTGPEGHPGPVNHVLPAWDALAGCLAAMGLLAAERHRRLTGQGQLVKLSLADVALAVSGHLGVIAEAELEAEPRARHGNDLYGTFARDFATRDGRRLIVLALTPRQWRSLVEATGLEAATRAIEEARSVDLREEGARFSCRREIAGLLELWISARSHEEVREIFERHGVLWGPYQTFKELVAGDSRCSTENPIFGRVADPDLGEHLVAGSPLRFGAVEAVPPRRGPRLGEHTEEVLRTIAGIGPDELAELRAAGIVAGAAVE